MCVMNGKYSLGCCLVLDVLGVGPAHGALTCSDLRDLGLARGVRGALTCTGLRGLLLRATGTLSFLGR